LELLAQYGHDNTGMQIVNKIEGEIEGVKVNIQPRRIQGALNKLKINGANINRAKTNISKQKTYARKILPSSNLKVLVTKNMS